MPMCGLEWPAISSGVTSRMQSRYSIFGRDLRLASFQIWKMKMLKKRVFGGFSWLLQSVGYSCRRLSSVYITFENWRKGSICHQLFIKLPFFKVCTFLKFSHTVNEFSDLKNSVFALTGCCGIAVLCIVEPSEQRAV